MEFVKKYPYPIIITLIILLSFRLFSTLYYPLVNSDEGIIVLMLHNFRLPDDIYFWGQDRYGAIVPLLGQIPFRLLGLSSLVSESLVHYLTLIAGFLALSTFIKSKPNKVIFAVAWFFPAIYYTDLLRNVFGLQYSLTGILLFLIKIYHEKFRKIELSWPQKLPWLFLILIVLVMAFWVSELSISIIAAFLVISILIVLKERKVHDQLWRPETYFAAFALAVTYLVITKLKSLSPSGPYDHYSESLLNSFPDMIKATGILVSGLSDILAFQIPDFLFSAYSWLIIILLISLIIYRKIIKIDKSESPWILIFALDIIIVIAIVVSSKWALSNEMPRRYFVGAHISFWMAFLMITSHLQAGKVKMLVSALALFTVLTGSVSTLYHIRFIEPKSFRPKAEMAREFTRFGKTGLIADYWNSYGISFANPDMIKATPYELSYSVRNFSQVDSVFRQPKIFLAKDMWLEDFPQEISQFDRTLTRKDSAFSLAGCTVNEYTIKRNWDFSIRDLKYPPDLVVFDPPLGKEVLKVGKDYRNSVYKYLVYGPFMTLLEGKYEADFSIRFDSLLTKGGDIAVLDVVADYGNNKLASLTLNPSLIPSTGEFHDYKLEFSLPEKCKTLEFRIYYLGGAMLTFDRVSVKKK